MLRNAFRWMGLACGAVALCATAHAGDINLHAGSGRQWYRGNTHTHTLWSDGEAAPEWAVKWYKDKGYHFLCLSDHNILSDGSVEKWSAIGGDSRLQPAQIAELQMLFGPDAVVLRKNQGRDEMKLKTLPEIRKQFEETGRFLLIQAEEITCVTPKVHVGAINIRREISPVNSSAAEHSMGESFRHIAEQEQEFGVPMQGHLNHPNWSSGVPVQSIIPVMEADSFEVFNGHPGVRNWGNAAMHMIDTNRIWDIVLSERLLQNPDAKFLGFATDDTHDYFLTGPKECNPGRGWVMVLSETLDADAITGALKAGNFYASSGVLLSGVAANKDGYRVEIDATPGVTYTTQFVGTRKTFDAQASPALDADGKPVPGGSNNYSDDIGMLLKETKENPAVYTYAGDELYVRAKVVSSHAKENAISEGDVEAAWTQPYLLTR